MLIAVQLEEKRKERKKETERKKKKGKERERKKREGRNKKKEGKNKERNKEGKEGIKGRKGKNKLSFFFSSQSKGGNITLAQRNTLTKSRWRKASEK